MATDNTSGKPRIVVGVDGSPSSFAALAWAAREADRAAATLDVVMAWEWPSSLGWAVPIPSDFNPEADVRGKLDSAVADVRADHPDLHLEPRVVNGHPAPTLVDASKGADLLVVGSRGHSEFLGMLLGSVSEYCATNAHCPVLIHRPTT
jgi:nucleotide-binding universal stress UspA family protein